MTIMIAEDNERTRDYIKGFLEESLENVPIFYECSNGSDAVRQYDEHRPQWILMDIMMEPGDGLSASREIMALNPDAKIIVVTNYDDSGYRKEAREIGVLGYVLKENLNEILPIMEEKGE